MIHPLSGIIDHHALPTIDLHDIPLISDALEELESLLYQFAQKKESYVRVIFGIGTGALFRAVETHLEGHPLVREIVYEQSGGSVVVVL